MEQTKYNNKICKGSAPFWTTFSFQFVDAIISLTCFSLFYFPLKKINDEVRNDYQGDNRLETIITKYENFFKLLLLYNK